MIRAVRSRGSVVAFGLSLAVIYAVALTILTRLGQLENPRVIAGALTLDLTLLVPLLYYLMLVRRRGWPALTVLPVFLISFLIAGRLIPSTQHHVLDLLQYGAALAEVALVTVIAYKAVQLRRGYRERAASGSDVYERLRESARSVLGSVAGGAVAYEAAVFYYVVAGWARSPETDEGAFTVHRSGGYAALMVAAVIALVVETFAIHLLVRLWSPVTAWILTGISVYAAVWLIGDFQAIRLRPVQISRGTLNVRVGLRWTIPVPLASIAAVAPPADAAPGHGRDHLKAVLIGAPNRRIELNEPVRAIGVYGLSRSVTTIDLQLDEPARFDAALRPPGKD